MRVSQVVHNSRIYGPGQRTVIWTQGCSIRCTGCWNDKLWDFNGGDIMSAEQLVHSTIENNDVGLTILGGEPLDQAEETRVRDVKRLPIMIGICIQLLAREREGFEFDSGLEDSWKDFGKLIEVRDALNSIVVI